MNIIIITNMNIMTVMSIIVTVMNMIITNMNMMSTNMSINMNIMNTIILMTVVNMMSTNMNIMNTSIIMTAMNIIMNMNIITIMRTAAAAGTIMGRGMRRPGHIRIL